MTHFFLDCGGLVRTDKKPAICKSYLKLMTELWHKSRYCIILVTITINMFWSHKWWISLSIVSNYFFWCVGGWLSQNCFPKTRKSNLQDVYFPYSYLFSISTNDRQKKKNDVIHSNKDLARKLINTVESSIKLLEVSLYLSEIHLECCT